MRPDNLTVVLVSDEQIWNGFRHINRKNMALKYLVLRCIFEENHKVIDPLIPSFIARGTVGTIFFYTYPKRRKALR